MSSGLRTTLRVIAVANLVFFIVGLMFAVPSLLQQWKVLRRWPSAQAVVVRSEVVPLQTASGQVLYDTEFELAYQVDGRPYLGRVTALHQSTHYERKKKQVERFPPGTRTVIRYNPADPADIRIQPGYNLHFFALPAFIGGVAAIFGVLALLFFALAARGRREPADHPG